MTIYLTPAEQAQADAIYAAHAETILATRDGSGSDLGLSRLTERLAGLGATADRQVIRAVRERLIEEAMRRNIAAGATPTIHLNRR